MGGPERASAGLPAGDLRGRQEAETEARAVWSLRAPRRLAAAWRWPRYATLAFGPSPLKDRLRRAGLIDARTGSTFEALERRGYIHCRHGANALGEPVVDVQLTRRGRHLVCVATGTAPAPHLPTGTLRVALNLFIRGEKCSKITVAVRRLMSGLFEVQCQ